MKIIKHGIILNSIFALILLVALSGIVSAVPQAPETFTVTESGRRGNQSAQTIEAEAGNVTALSVDAQIITQAWQGYYGNITGTITLDDADNITFYDWSLSSPTGEIYALMEAMCLD